MPRWFEDRWEDRWCIDRHLPGTFSYHRGELGTSGGASAFPHLPQDRLSPVTGSADWFDRFRIPRDFGNTLLEFQIAVVKIAAHHLNKRDGVLIGDVVGLGKTLMATAVARIFEDDYELETLIICPKNLVPMWED